MIYAFLTARGLFGLAKGWWLLIVIAAAAGLVAWAVAAERADDAHNQEIGAAVQREGDLRTTLDRVEKANEAADKIERNPVARRDGCLRHSRTPENC